MNLTHSNLVKSAYKWVKKNASCGVVFHELVAGDAYEIPDVIGFGSNELSVLIECKASRSDFLNDFKKHSRQVEVLAMGRYRFFCCPEQMISIEELPAKWGLLWVNEAGKARAIINPMRVNYEKRFKWEFEYSKSAERKMLYSALRRLSLRGYIEKIYEKPSLDLWKQKND